MEYATKGTLFNLIRKKKYFDEDEAFFYFIQACAGIYFLHQHGLIHRDIKPENMLISANHTLKICDFGWCVESETPRETFCGTLEYMAPEMIANGAHNHTLDVWCLGVLLYELIHGYAPFTGNQKKISKKIIECKIKFKDTVSPDLKDLITNIL